MISKTIGIIPRNLIKNKKRTISIAISIILSISLITSMEILIRSVVNASVDAKGKLAGKYHAAYNYVHKEDLHILGENEKVKDIGTTAFVGFGTLDDYKLEVNGIDEKAKDMLNVEILEGNYPAKDDEIAIEKWILDKSYPGIEVGDKIKFPLEYYKRRGANEDYTKEVEFTLSGILNNLMGVRASGAGKGFLSISGAEKMIPIEDIAYKQYLTIKSNYPVESTVEYFNDEYENKAFGNYEINTPYMFVVNASQKSRIIVLIIDIIVALVASIMLYNIFNISVSERLKQFGLLKSIGITPFQMKSIVLGEGILLGIIFIPLGIFSGIIITNLLFSVIGMSGRNLIINSSTYSIWTISISGFLSIILSLFKPGQMASRVSVIEALRSDSSIDKISTKIENKTEKSSKSQIGYIGKMAFKNIKRNKKRFIATVSSISMGVTIFIAINYLVEGIDPMKEIKKLIRTDYIVQLSDVKEGYGYSDNDVNMISNIKGINNTEKYRFLYGTAALKINDLTQYGIKVSESLAETSEYSKRRISTGIYDVTGVIIGCSKESMEKLERDLKISKSKDTNGNVIPAYLVQNLNGNQTINLKAGDVINVEVVLWDTPKWKHINSDIQVEGILKENPFKMGQTEEGFVLIAEDSYIEKAFGIDGYQKILVDIDDKLNDIPSIEKELKTIATSQKGGELKSYREYLDSYKRVTMQITIILYVFFIVTALAAIVNIANTISMNVITRKREFGMLRAIGMTRGQIRRMIVVEGITYGFSGALFGGILGILLSYFIYLGAKGSIILSLAAELKWQIHFIIISIVFIITMLITTVSTIIPLKRTTSVEVIEAIRAIE